MMRVDTRGKYNTMKSHRLDTFARQLATPHSRRTVLKTIAAGLTLAVAGLRESGSARAAFPEEVVLDYYDAVQKHEWRKAYDLFGANLQRAHSYDSFIQGYAKTQCSSVRIDNVGDDGVITVTVVAWLVDGTPQQFEGFYKVGTERGKNRILSAKIESVDASSVPPLCIAEKLGASMTSNAGTGHRFGEITVVNEGDACTLAGMPRVSISTAGGKRLISGKREPATTIQAVRLEKGNSALLELDWTNWCGATITGDVKVNVTLGAETGRKVIDHGFGVPPCLGEPGSASRLAVKPWQPT